MSTQMPLSAPLDLALGTPPAERQRLDALLEAVPLAVALFDGALMLVATNARYRDLTGLDVAQAMGRPIYDAFPNALAAPGSGPSNTAYQRRPAARRGPTHALMATAHKPGIIPLRPMSTGDLLDRFPLRSSRPGL